MFKYYITFGFIFITFSFIFYVLGLMKIVPIIYTVIPMFLSILFTVHCWNNRNRFKGTKQKMIVRKN